MDSLQQASTGNKIVAGVAFAALVGVGATLYSANENKKQEKRAIRTMRRQKRLAKLQQQADSEDNRVATLFFNDKDELIEATQAKEEIQKQGKKFQKVQVSYGMEEDITKIPKYVFGKEKTKNAKIFLQKYQDQKEIIQKHKDLPELLDMSSYSGNSLQRDCYDDNGDKKAQQLEGIDLCANKKNIVLNLHEDDKQQEKPKDDLFFDFFSMYTKNFISEKEASNKREKQREQLFQI
jgi:hypothetical protein